MSIDHGPGQDPAMWWAQATDKETTQGSNDLDGTHEAIALPPHGQDSVDQVPEFIRRVEDGGVIDSPLTRVVDPKTGELLVSVPASLAALDAPVVPLGAPQIPPTYPPEQSPARHRPERRSRPGLYAVIGGLVVAGGVAGAVSGLGGGASAEHDTNPTSKPGNSAPETPGSTGQNGPSSPEHNPSDSVPSAEAKQYKAVAAEYGLTLNSLAYSPNDAVFADKAGLPTLSILDQLPNITKTLTPADFTADKLGGLFAYSVLANTDTDTPAKTAHGPYKFPNVANYQNTGFSERLMLYPRTSDYGNWIKSITPTVAQENGTSVLNVVFQLAPQAHSLIPNQPANAQLGAKDGSIFPKVTVTATINPVTKQILSINFLGKV